MIDLRRWMTQRPQGAILCRRGEQGFDSDAFARDVASLVSALEQRGSGRWLVCTESAYACAVALFALWHCGSIAVMPANLEAGTLGELAPGARGVLSDDPLTTAGPQGPSSFGDFGVLKILGWPAAPARPWGELDRSKTVVELCTSGSTGARKVVPKTLLQLESEIAALEHEFGARLAGACALGTVSFQHIYGLLFRVLWPLCAGRVFADSSIVDPAQISRAVGSMGRAALVSSPAHLKRMPELLELAQLGPSCVEVFSSGGALDEATALRFEAELGFAPLEVLGSTETGGIGWRRQGQGAGPDWRAFPGVRVAAPEGLLRVTSLPAGTEDVTTGDAASIVSEGRFRLLGRADRIVKLFDERISLVELESRLGAHPLLQACAALTLERQGTSRIAAVVVLSADGERLVRESGKSELVAALRAHLGLYFRATALPRAWRIAERLPEDAQGKTSVAALQALFQENNPSRTAVLVARCASSASEFEVELEVPRDLWCLRGHFDGFPVVPGVVQVQWALEWATEWLGEAPKVRGLEALKFKRMLSDGTRFSLRIERAPGDPKLRFRLWNQAGEFSSGRVLVEASGS